MKNCLKYDPNIYQEVPAVERNSLQLFITNRCNMRCKGCFYAHRLGKTDMSFEDYKRYIEEYKNTVERITILGGEPTLHKDLAQMVAYNQSKSLKTTIYSNGLLIKKMESIPLENVQFRVGVYGLKNSEKPLNKVPDTNIPLMVVYMLRRDNIDELLSTAYSAEKRFNTSAILISSIRDIAVTKSYWKDTPETVSNEEYFDVVQEFLNSYEGNLDVQISKRGVIKSLYDGEANCCRFGNIFPDGTMIQCPFDISLEKKCDNLLFGEKKCNKDSKCILKKVIFRNKKRF